MKFVLLLTSLAFSSFALAAERSFYSCVGSSPEFQLLVVKQVVVSNGSSVVSTFKVDAMNEAAMIISYAQDGEVMIGADSSFQGKFKAGTQRIELNLLQWKSERLRVSTLKSGNKIYPLNCSAL